MMNRFQTLLSASTCAPTAWLEQFLATFPGTVVAITHDRYFLVGWSRLTPG